MRRTWKYRRRLQTRHRGKAAAGRWRGCEAAHESASGVKTKPLLPRDCRAGAARTWLMDRRVTHLCGHGDVVAIGCNRSVSSALQLVKLLDFVLQTAWVMTHGAARAAEVTCCCRCTCSTWDRCIASLAAASSMSCCRCSWMLRSNLQLKISCLVKKAYEFRVCAEGKTRTCRS